LTRRPVRRKARRPKEKRVTLDDVTTKFAANQAVIPNKRIRFDFAGDGALMLDGVAGAVSNDNGPADLAIAMNLTDLAAIRAGTLDPMSAYFSGRIRLDGDVMLAMRLRELMAKLGG
jgi:putative sterol carrier protein